MNVLFEIKVRKRSFDIGIESKVWNSVTSWVNIITSGIPVNIQFSSKLFFRIFDVVLSIKNFIWNSKVWNCIVYWVCSSILSEIGIHFLSKRLFGVSDVLLSIFYILVNSKICDWVVHWVVFFKWWNRIVHEVKVMFQLCFDQFNIVLGISDFMILSKIWNSVINWMVTISWWLENLKRLVVAQKWFSVKRGI